jgi:hypothetical protein
LSGAKSAPVSGTEQFGAEMVRDTPYDATIPSRGMPPDDERPIDAP